MPEDTNLIPIIAGPQPVVAEPLDSQPATGAGVLHGQAQSLPALFTTTPVDKLTSQIEALRGQLGTLVKSLAQSVTDNAQLEEITVSLAISLNGDIGIASAGAEASVELTFKVNQ